MSESKPKKILIAEDEKAYSRALVLKLKNAGYEAESVANGEEVISTLKKTRYDLLLCDIIMPKMNGFQVLEEIRKQGMKVPVFVLSNLSQADDEKKALALGATGFLSKSNSPIAEVISKIQQFLTKK
jgi:CheY-like chemotaxis protein